MEVASAKAEELTSAEEELEHEPDSKGEAKPDECPPPWLQQENVCDPPKFECMDLLWRYRRTRPGCQV